MAHIDHNGQRNSKRRKNQSDISHKVACDRCRGQKLRCIWELNSRQCHRCTRAKAECFVAPPRPMGRPQRQSAPLVRHSTQTFGSEDESRQVFESVPMYPSLQDKEDAVMDIQTSDEPFWLDSSDTDPAQIDTSWYTNFPPPANDEGGPSSPSSYLQPDFWMMLNHLSGSPFPNGQKSSNASNSMIEIPLEHATSIHKDAAAATNGATGDKGKESSVGPSLDAGFESKEEDLKQVIQLCKLTIELCKHPLQGPSTKSPSYTPTTTTQNGVHSTGETVRLADLGIGKLLSLEAQIRSAVPQKFTNEANPAQTSNQIQVLAGRSTILLVLSCYFRLEMIFLSTLDTLHEVRKSGKPLEDSHRLMPGLVFDGFPLGTHRGIQLSFAIQLCEQTLEAIRETSSECGKRVQLL